MQFSPETPRRNIVIQGVSFSVPAPFSAGHPLSETEAAVMNQTLGENLRNNFASSIRAAVEEYAKTNQIDPKDVAPSDLDQEELQIALDEYAAAYEFGVRRGTGGTSPKDPVEREAMAMAKDAVRGALKRKGYKISKVPEDQIAALAEQLLKNSPEMLEEARRRVEQARKIGEASINLDVLLNQED